MFTDSKQFIESVILKTNEVPSFDEYPYDIPAIRSLTQLPLHPKVTYFIGDNGAGKSTLLEAIAVCAGFNAEGGSKNFNFSTRASHSELHSYLMLRKGTQRPRDGYFFRAESFFNAATTIEQIDDDPDNMNYNSGPPISLGYGNRPLHEQSHGESFLALMLNRFGGNGVYLLDEPEAALSPAKQMSVLSAMHNLINQHSQFVIVTHSPILMAYPDSTIYCFSDGPIAPIDYEETEHYTITRDFIERREQIMRILLEE